MNTEREKGGQFLGPEISVVQAGVPCGLFQKRTEPGYLLADGTALLESEQDSLGRYKGGAGMDGMYLQTGRLYEPILSESGQITAFREVKDGTINKKAPTPAVLESEDEALYLVNGTTYLYIQTNEDNRSYTRDDCYTTYDYTLYDKETLRQLDGGQMEIVEDVRYDPRHYLHRAAENILDCRTLLGGASIEPVSLDMLEILQGTSGRETKAAENRTANGKAPKPSLRDSLKRCQAEVKAHPGELPAKPRCEPER